MAEKKAVNKVVEPTNEEIDAHVDQLVAKAQVALSSNTPRPVSLTAASANVP